jgi:hypothetical protein
MTNKTIAFKTLDTFADSRVDAYQRVCKKQGTRQSKRVDPIVIEWACRENWRVSKEGFKVHDVSGKVSLITKHPKYETTKTVVRDMMHMIEGTSA